MINANRVLMLMFLKKFITAPFDSIGYLFYILYVGQRRSGSGEVRRFKAGIAGAGNEMATAISPFQRAAASR